MSKSKSKTGAKKTGTTKAIKKPAAGKRIGLLEAAFKVLCQKAEPMCIKEIMAQINKRRLYTPPRAGKTPERSLSSALMRALSSPNPLKFVKSGKGQFTVKK